MGLEKPGSTDGPAPPEPPAASTDTKESVSPGGSGDAARPALVDLPSAEKAGPATSRASSTGGDRAALRDPPRPPAPGAAWSLGPDGASQQGPGAEGRDNGRGTSEGAPGTQLETPGLGLTPSPEFEAYLNDFRERKAARSADEGGRPDSVAAAGHSATREGTDGQGPNSERGPGRAETTDLDDTTIEASGEPAARQVPTAGEVSPEAAPATDHRPAPDQTSATDQSPAPEVSEADRPEQPAPSVGLPQRQSLSDLYDVNNDSALPLSEGQQRQEARVFLEAVGVSSQLAGDATGRVDHWHPQGQNDLGIRGTCGVVAVEAVAKDAGIPGLDEDRVLAAALTGGHCQPDGGTTPESRRELLAELGVESQVAIGQSVGDLASHVEAGHGVIARVSAGELWQSENASDYAFSDTGDLLPNHAVVVTGTVRDGDGNLTGFILNDSSGALPPAHLVSPDRMVNCWQNLGRDDLGQELGGQLNVAELGVRT